MEITNNNFIPKKNDKMKKIDKTAQKKKNKPITDSQSHTYITETHTHYNEETARVQRSITKNQVVLAGLETLRSIVESGMTKEESISFLKEIVEKTQFDNEKVLEEYKQSLEHALNRGVFASIERHIKKVQDSIVSLTEELEMNEMKKHNLRSLKSISREDNPEELMQKVIKSLKKEGLPRINIPRERISDLLGD